MLRRFTRLFYANKPSWLSGRHWADSPAYESNRVSKENQISDALKKALPGISYISVNDISGGCGDMFEISIEAREFKGLSMVKQHQLVTQTLKSQIEKMHGIRIHTTVPQESQ